MGIVYGPKWPFYSCCDYIGLLGTSFMQVLYLGRAPRTNETLPDFLNFVFRKLPSTLYLGNPTSTCIPRVNG